MGKREPTGSKLEHFVGPPEKPTANKLNLTGVFGLVAPLAATMALFKATGSIGRIQRDDSKGLLFAIGFVLVAGTMVTVATFLAGEGESTKGKWVERSLFGLAILCTLVGFIIAFSLVFKNSSEEPRPAITAALSDDQSELTAHVTASNLKTDHRLAIRIDLATVGSDTTVDGLHPSLKEGTLPLERTYVGPDSDGDVDQRIAVWIPPGGNYTNLVIKAYTADTNRPCRDLVEGTERGTACTILYLDPHRGAR